MFAETHIVVRLEVSFSSLIEGFGIVFILLGCAFSMMIIMSAQLETQILYLLMALVFGMFAILPELFGHLPIEKAGYGTGVDEFDKLVKVNRAIIPIFLLSFTLLGNIIFGQFLERMNFTHCSCGSFPYPFSCWVAYSPDSISKNTHLKIVVRWHPMSEERLQTPP